MRIPGGDEDRFGFWFDDEFGVQDSILSIVGTPTYTESSHRHHAKVQKKID